MKVKGRRSKSCGELEEARRRWQGRRRSVCCSESREQRRRKPGKAVAGDRLEGRSSRSVALKSSQDSSNEMRSMPKSTSLRSGRQRRERKWRVRSGGKRKKGAAVLRPYKGKAKMPRQSDGATFHSQETERRKQIPACGRETSPAEDGDFEVAATRKKHGSKDPPLLRRASGFPSTTLTASGMTAETRR